MDTNKFPITSPCITFYPDKTWILRFADAPFPAIAYGLGICINFNSENIATSMDILSEYN